MKTMTAELQPAEFDIILQHDCDTPNAPWWVFRVMPTGYAVPERFSSERSAREYAEANGVVRETRRKEYYFKTAVAVVGCAAFKVGEFVSLEFYHWGTDGTAWYLIRSSSGSGQLERSVAYPAHHLKDFCL